jgi:anti-sigma B factor antagonist
MDIAIESNADGAGRMVLRVTGSIDLQTRSQLLDAGRAAMAKQPSAVVLDLSGVSFIDSTGIGALVEIGHAAADDSDNDNDAGGLILRNPSPRVIRILDISGLRDAWPIESGE